MITKFATIYMSATGSAFFGAASDITNILKRHLLSTVAVWWIPNLVVSVWTLLMTVLYGVAVAFFVLRSSVYQLADDRLKLILYIAIGVQIYLVLQIVGFFMSTIVNVVDALYIGFALDKDQGETRSSEMHQVFA